MGFRIVLWRSPGMKICGRSSVVVVGVVVVVVVVVVAVVVDVVVVTAGVFVVMVVVVAAGVVSSSISDSTISNSISGTSEPSSSSSSVSTTSTSKSPSSSSGPSTKSISAVAAAATVVVSNAMPTTSDSLPSSLDCSDTHNSASMGLTVGTSVRIPLGPVAIPPSMVSSMISISIKVNSGPSLSKEGTVVVVVVEGKKAHAVLDVWNLDRWRGDDDELGWLIVVFAGWDYFCWLLLLLMLQ
mmetsp:Transcript_23920/g.51745  ORF Transcript_23920/g.51745 Transcript_23920/m.51745 type:complete len:241 (+) Transcript_23920:1579-2301(+)